MSRDLRVTITVRNAIMLRAIEAAGFDSVAAFARSAGVGYQNVIDFVSLRRTPFTRNGELNPTILKVAIALGAMPEDLFPARFLHQALEKNRVTRDVAVEDIPALMAEAQETPEALAIVNEAAENLSAVIDTLKPREALMLRMRYGLDGHEPHELGTLAKKMNISVERVRQIVLKAERKLKNPARNVRALCAPLMGGAAWR